MFGPHGFDKINTLIINWSNSYFLIYSYIY
jgi:hypothetical protein